MLGSTRKLDRQSAAEELLEWGLRPSAVRHLTGCSRHSISLATRVYQTRTGLGRWPTVPGILNRLVPRVHGSVFISICESAIAKEAAGFSTERLDDVFALMRAHQIYRRLAEDLPGGREEALTADQAFVLAEAWEKGEVSLRPCPKCRTDYVVLRSGEIQPGCPYCTLESYRLI